MSEYAQGSNGTLTAGSTTAVEEEGTAPTLNELNDLEIGIIGMGDMGRLYATKFAEAGFKRYVLAVGMTKAYELALSLPIFTFSRRVNVCDRPEAFEKLKSDLKSTTLNVLSDGHLVARRSDVIIYSVEAARIDQVVAQYGPSSKMGAIVSGQTSVKAPECAAFEKHLPRDVHIISCHSLHGPKVDTTGQPLVLIQHRASDDKMELMQRLFASFKPRFVHLSYEDHDIVTANTQAVTHAAFLT